MKVNVRLLLLGGILLVAVSILGWSLRPTATSIDDLKSMGLVVLDPPVTYDNLELIDEDGEVFDGSRLKGKWTFAFFGYTHCPDICPTTLAQMRTVYKNLEEQGDTLTLQKSQRLFVSIDAKRDNHEAVKSYTDGIDPALIGVTGTPEKVKEFADSVYVGFQQLGNQDAEEDYLVNHQGNIIVFDPNGNGWGVIRSPFEDPYLARVFSGLVRQELI